MNILFDARYVNKKSSGVGYYTLNLLKALFKLNINHHYQYIIHNQEQQNLINIDSYRFRPYQSLVNFESHPLFELHQNLYLPYKMRQENFAVFHGPAMFIPFIKNKNYKLIATIHDLVAFLHPETVPKKYLLYLKFMTKKIISKADKIIAASQSTKNDLLNIFGVPEDKIAVTHYAPAEIFFSPPLESEEILNVKRKFNLPERFLLSVGTIEPRKNLKRLIEAFLILKDKGIKDIKLVMVGNKGWLNSAIFKQAAKAPKDIIFTGYVTAPELKALYQTAEIFVFPSLYEGFGLPLLEAMACHTPIAASNTSSIPEIVKNAAVLFNPQDKQKIVDALHNLLENNTLKEKLKQQGKERIKSFSWNNTAKATMEVYEQFN